MKQHLSLLLALCSTCVGQSGTITIKSTPCPRTVTEKQCQNTGGKFYANSESCPYCDLDMVKFVEYIDALQLQLKAQTALFDALNKRIKVLEKEVEDLKADADNGSKEQP